jgi:plasmid stabilization system protein ParE
MRSWPSIRPAPVREVYRQTASDDILRQFRYYLLTAEAPEIALRFRDAVRRAIQSLSQNPNVGPRYSSSNARVQNLRSWPVAGFEAIRIYYALEEDTMHIIRILHGKRDVRRILGNE